MKKTKFIVCMLFLVSVIVCITGCTIQSRNIGLNVTYSNTASYTAKATVTISNIDLNSLNSSDQINLSKVTIFYAYDSVKQKYLDSIASSDPTSGFFIYPDNTKIDGSVSYTVLSNEVNAFKLSNKNSWSHDFDITFLDEAKNREISYVVLLEGNDIGMTNGMTFGAPGYATSKVFKFNEPEHHPRVEPTCTEDGNIEYWTKFGVYYSDKDCTQVLTPDTAIAKLGHDWDEPEYTWDKVDNEWICVAKRVCKRDADHVETETADIAVRIDTDPTCEENGSTTYTATFDNPDFEKQTHTESDIAAIGHKFIHFIKWVWDGFNKLIAWVFCDNDPQHVETIDVPFVIDTYDAPTCTEDGYNYYVATIDIAGQIYKTVKIETLDQLGHDWDEAEYTWAEDYSTVTAQRICKRDAEHNETETVTTTYEVVTEPTFQNPGVGRYTSNEFENEAFAVQTTDVEIPANLCTVTFDSNGGTSVESQLVDYMSLATKPTDDPTKEGFEFVGWYLNGEEYDFDTPVTGDITLVAQWKEIVSDTESDVKTSDTESDVKTSDTESDTKTSDTESDTKTSDTESDTKTSDTESDTKTSDTESDTKTSDTESDTKTSDTESDTKISDTESDTKTSDTESDTDTTSDIESDTDSEESPDTPDTPDTPDKPLYGDVNLDGKVTARDSLWAQRYVIHLANLSKAQFINADVDLDGVVTVKDAMYILRYTIKLAVLPSQK